MTTSGTVLDDLVRGDGRTLTINNLTDSDGNPASLQAGDVLWFTAKRYLVDADLDALIAVNSTAGQIVFTAGASTATVTLHEDDFPATLGADTAYVWDVQLLRTGETDPRTLARGTGTLLADVTIETAVAS